MVGPDMGYMQRDVEGLGNLAIYRYNLTHFVFFNITFTFQLNS